MNINPARLLKSSRLLTFILILALSILPIVLTWGKTIIGGDMTIPFSSRVMDKYLFQWIGIQNGSYFSINYYPLYLFYKIVEFFGLGYYQISGLILFLLNFVAGLGIWKLAKIYQNAEKPSSFVIPITFYLLSPALLNSWHYLYIYTFLPWFVFLIIKCIKKKDIKVIDVIWLNLVLFFASLDLPNPKYIFYLLLTTFIISVSGYFLRLIDGKLLLKAFWSFVLSLLLSSYLILPLSNFVLNYSAVEYGVSVIPGHSGSTGMMDLGTATIDKMINLHHSGVNVNVDEKRSYVGNPFVTAVSYLYILLILIDLCLMKKTKRENDMTAHKLILTTLIITFLALSSGPNPPFGFIYEYLVTTLPVLAFLRTTAGAVYFLSLFYSIYLFIIVQENQKYQRALQTLLVIAILVTGYPLLTGDFYEVNTNINQYAEKNSRGFRLPTEYFEVAPIINTSKIDAKTFYPGLDASYINTTWGYFGPLFYSSLYKSTPISDKTVIYSQAYHNINFVFVDQSATNKASLLKPLNTTELFAGKNIKLYQTSTQTFLPHIYTPQILANTTEELATASGGLSSIRSAIYPSNYEIPEKIINNTPVLEFKKINQTKYRVVVHGAKRDFPLIFSETYNQGWKVYLTATLPQIDQTDKYKILDGNVDNQATKEELKQFIERGYLTDLGDGKEKEIKHYRWTGNKEAVDYIERYNIDFVSKNFQDTIQNDNLPNGSFYETWFKKPISLDSHKLVNGYANSWNFDLEKICHVNSNCIKNNDGSYDFEIVIEFWPQRLFYIGLGISGLTLILCLLGSFLKYLTKKNV